MNIHPEKIEIPHVMPCIDLVKGQGSRIRDCDTTGFDELVSTCGISASDMCKRIDLKFVSTRTTLVSKDIFFEWQKLFEDGDEVQYRLAMSCVSEWMEVGSVLSPSSYAWFLTCIWKRSE